MKQLQDIDFRAAYGPVPDGFSPACSRHCTRRRRSL